MTVEAQVKLPQALNIRNQLKCNGVTNTIKYLRYGCWCGPSNTGGRTLDKLDG